MSAVHDSLEETFSNDSYRYSFDKNQWIHNHRVAHQYSGKTTTIK